ncbi:hypothetical protein X734_29620 [Mesorhizobium sp. L2C084A000]|nr:hypothetical protein X734_29620 [Mesorhizobium sp. L2C084A000]
MGLPEIDIGLNYFPQFVPGLSPTLPKKAKAGPNPPLLP